MRLNLCNISSLRALDSSDLGRIFLDCVVCDLPKPPRVGTGYSGDCPDWLQRLGDRIAALTLSEATELREYIEERRLEDDKPFRGY